MQIEKELNRKQGKYKIFGNYVKVENKVKNTNKTTMLNRLGNEKGKNDGKQCKIQLRR